MSGFGHKHDRPHEVKERIQLVASPDLVRRIKKDSKEHKITQGEFICRAVESYYQSAHKVDIEVQNLKSIIAKELSENDAFGSEYVIASILREENAKLKAALERIIETDAIYAANNQPGVSRLKHCVAVAKEALE